MKQFDLQGNEYDCNIELPKDITDVSFRFSKDVLFKSWQDEALRHREEILHLKDQLQQKENIIKEVKEYVETKEKDDDNWVDYELLIEPVRIKEILDRGSDEQWIKKMNGY